MTDSTTDITRRGVLRGATGVAAAGVLGSTPAAAQTAEPTEPDYGDWFDDVSNYEETVDRTGQSEVTVTVGAEGNDGNLAFDPPAVRVDPGTTIRWEWNGEGGTHNVVAEDGSFESEMTDEAGFTFEHAVAGAGLTKYSCLPHKQMGMKGAIVVDGAGQGASDWSETAVVGGAVGLAGVLTGLVLSGGSADDQSGDVRRS